METKATGEKTVDAIVQVANTLLTQVRISMLSYGEQMLSASGFVSNSAMYDECYRAMRLGTDCEALWKMQQELEKRLQKTPGWMSTIWANMSRVASVATDGEKYILKSASGAVIGVVYGVWSLFQYLMPYLLKFSNYMLLHPKAAIVAFLYAKHIQKNVCRYVSRWYLLNGKELPPESFMDSIKPGVHIHRHGAPDRAAACPKWGNPYKNTTKTWG